MSLRLAYVRQMFEAVGGEQKNLFIRQIPGQTINHHENQFITRALESLGFNPARKTIPLLAKTVPPFVYEISADVELVYRTPGHGLILKRHP